MSRALGGVITQTDQASRPDYIGVSVDGPFSQETYRLLKISDRPPAQLGGLKARMRTEHEA